MGLIMQNQPKLALTSELIFINRMYLFILLKESMHIISRINIADISEYKIHQMLKMLQVFQMLKMFRMFLKKQ